MNQQKLNYIHYYLLAIVSAILVWGGFEYISICNGKNCMIDTSRLWSGLALIVLIFIPITLCIWSEYVNDQLKKLLSFFKQKYEEQILIFGMLILFLLSLLSYEVFNFNWDIAEKSRESKEYVAALVNLAIFVATIFAPIAALLLYNNWKIQHNKILFSKEAKEIWLLIYNIECYLTDLKLAIDNAPTQYLGFSELNSYHEKYKKLTEGIEKFEPKYAQFIALTENEKLYTPYHKYEEHHGKFSNFYKNNKDQLRALSDIKQEENNLREGLKAPFISMKDMLHNYIIIK